MQICKPETALLGHLLWAELNAIQSSDFRQDSLPSTENCVNISKMDFKFYKPVLKLSAFDQILYHLLRLAVFPK